MTRTDIAGNRPTLVLAAQVTARCGHEGSNPHYRSKSEAAMNHWHCTACHHEWDGSEDTCAWCGKPGRVMSWDEGVAYESRKLRELINRMIRRAAVSGARDSRGAS